MSEIILKDYNDIIKIRNARVYDLDESVKASKYPMSTDISKCDSDITERQVTLGTCLSGSAHDCFLKGIICNFDLTCTNKMWVEFQRYHFADIISSQSTMHKITKMSIEESCIDYVTENIINEANKLIDIYNENKTDENYKKVLYNIPSGLQLTARVTTNYLQLKTMLKQRKNHRLQEWREFCKWIERLPKSELFIKNNKE